MTTPTGNEYLDSIVWGGWRWVSSSGPLVLTYYFDDDYSTWTDAEKTAYRAAFQSWADVADFTIQEVFTESEANFVAHSVSNTQMNDLLQPPEGSIIFGYHETPDEVVSGQIHGYYNYDTYSWPSHGITYNVTGLVEGGWGYRMMIHELGHGLGLAHPHDTGGGSNIMPGVDYPDDYGNYNLNQGVYTLMSYNRGWEAVQNAQGNGISAYGYNYGPAAFDIAVIQYLYGANINHSNGDTTYTIIDNGAWLSIWDTGGIDEIVYSGSKNVTIDLRSATLDTSANAGGYLSYAVGAYGGFTIAGDFTNALANQVLEKGVIIENASGGSGADTINGNSVANILRGNGGIDTIRGFEGNDTLYGDAGNDFLYGGVGFDKIAGGTGNDQIWGELGVDVLSGGADNDTIYGGDHNDSLYGNGGDDWLYGDTGFDKIAGGDGVDRLYGGLGVDLLFADAGNDFLYGEGQNDQLNGGAGNDWLDGGTGNDELTGGADHDTFYFTGAFGTDTIKDFNIASTTEKIDISTVSTITDWTDLRNNHMSQVGANVEIVDGLGNKIIIENRDINLLSEGDFVI